MGEVCDQDPDGESDFDWHHTLRSQTTVGPVVFYLAPSPLYRGMGTPLPPSWGGIPPYIRVFSTSPEGGQNRN